MTVYKPIKPLAEKAAEVALKMIRNELISGINASINNGKIEVPSILLEPIQVDTSNLVQTVIADGFHKLEDVYKNVPTALWPDLESN